MIRILDGALRIAAIAVPLAVSCALADELDPLLGKALFERQWIQAPASVDAANGLGPLYNASSCNTCHKGGGGARFSLIDGELGVGGLVVRLGDAEGRPDPYYGRQLQERAVVGLAAEARIFPHLAPASRPGLTWMTAEIDLEGPPLAAGTRSEFRIAPSLAGRALLARVSARAVLALADPDDRDKDGISGRARLIDGRLGRFGLKATATGIREQAADAALFDIGLSSPARPFAFGDCTTQEKECLAMAKGRSAGIEGPEISDEMIDLIAAYVGSLNLPASHRAALPAAFAQAGCDRCHVPTMAGEDGTPLPVFTDLLLHDLGPGLAGAFDDGFATAGEWRTAPLIDLDPSGGRRRYLHDGRAGTIAEAILWHGGEAESARIRFEALSDADKAALIAFVKSQ